MSSPPWKTHARAGEVQRIRGGRGRASFSRTFFPLSSRHISFPRDFRVGTRASSFPRDCKWRTSALSNESRRIPVSADRQTDRRWSDSDGRASSEISKLENASTKIRRILEDPERSGPRTTERSCQEIKSAPCTTYGPSEIKVYLRQSKGHHKIHQRRIPSTPRATTEVSTDFYAQHTTQLLEHARVRARVWRVCTCMCVCVCACVLRTCVNPETTSSLTAAYIRTRTQIRPNHRHALVCVCATKLKRMFALDACEARVVFVRVAEVQRARCKER